MENSTILDEYANNRLVRHCFGAQFCFHAQPGIQKSKEKKNYDEFACEKRKNLSVITFLIIVSQKETPLTLKKDWKMSPVSVM